MTSNPGGMAGIGGGLGGGGAPTPPPISRLNKRVSVSFPLVREGNYLVSYTDRFEGV
jgi:hypothetical protein